jgi:hypothetical protein
MKKINFENQEYYVGYKVISKNGINYQNNFQYEPGYWYEALDVDMSDADCSYGLNIFNNFIDAFGFMAGIVYECYIPIKNNKIKFIQNQSKFVQKILILILINIGMN